MKTFSIHEISQAVDGTLEGASDITITGVGEISEATEGQLTFIGEKKYIKLWQTSCASAAVVNAGFQVQPGEHQALVRVANADLAMARVLEMFTPEAPLCPPGIHSSATVDPTAIIGDGTSIGAGCYIGPGVVIGTHTCLYPNVTVMDASTIGNHTIVWSGTVIRERCRIGDRCILHPNVTIGSDGFGYRPAPDGRGLVKIPHIGIVIIGNDVELGAGTCVDRGKFSATVIGDGTKIDNLVQIAHNCTVGRSCAMSGQSGLAGSVTLGDGVIMGGAARVKDHVTVGSGARLGGGAGLINDLEAGKTVLGIPADDYKQTLRQWAALKQLPDLLKQLKKK
jgi:UDP-3-O-[3-hydroxymyristoyl] glucosamine N-acyltransferase